MFSVWNKNRATIWSTEITRQGKSTFTFLLKNKIETPDCWVSRLKNASLNYNYSYNYADISQICISPRFFCPLPPPHPNHTHKRIDSSDDFPFVSDQLSSRQLWNAEVRLEDTMLLDIW